MKFLVILLSLLTMSVAVAAPKKLAKLPTYTPNNPYGKWTALPNGNNYLFCGDRIIYGSNFNEKIKIQYNGEDRSMTVREHCEMRRRELERAVATRTSEEPTLIQLQYEKIASHLKKVPGGIKAGRMYSFREIRKAMKAGELNNLRAANMMLPVLTESEFTKLYAGETNNPQFTKTEHERYVSNLMTQNPAMLYTANGSLYYFSLNLSNDQLKLLASVVGSGGGGGGIGGGSSGSFAGGSGGSIGNPESGSGRRQLNNALEGARQNPFEGSKLASNLNVRPQATTLPSSFGVDSSATLVPYDMKMPSVSFGPTRGVASSGGARAERVKAVTVSSNPSLGMMNIGGAGRPSSGSGSRGSSGGGASSSGSSGKATGSGSGYQGSTNGAGKVNVAAAPASGEPLSATAATLSNANAAGLPNKENLLTNPLTISRSGNGTALPGLNSPDGPPPIILGKGDGLDFENPNYTCSENQWEQLLYQTNAGNFAIKDATKPETQCLPFAEQQFSSSLFCGVGTKGLEYSASCVQKDDDRNSCYDQIMIDTGKICSQYFEIKEPFNHDDILLCAERLFVIACDKIPCTIEPTIIKKKNEKDEEIELIGELVVKELNMDSFFTKSASTGRFASGTKTVPYEEILKLPSVIREHKHQKVATGSKITLPPTNKNWLRDVAKDQLKDHLLKISLFYQTEMNNKCKFETQKEYHFSGSR